MKNWQIAGFLPILVIAFILVSGCTQDNSKYCTDNFPGTYYDPSSKMCEHTQEPTTIPTPILIPPTSVPTIVTTQVPTQYLEGTFGECYSDEGFYQVCVEKKPTVSIIGNIVSASGTIIFNEPSPIQSPDPQHWEKRKIYDELKDVSVNVTLKIYNKNKVKVTDVSKTYSVDKNGKTLIDLSTNIPENNPIGWTYGLTVGKHTESVFSAVTPTPTRTSFIVPTVPAIGVVNTINVAK